MIVQSDSMFDSLPVGWKVDRIKDVIPKVFGGGTPDSSEPEYWEDGSIVWITPTDFQDYENELLITTSRRNITEKGLKSCSAILLPEGTVIMASRASIGDVKIAGTELCTNQGFISFVCDKLSNKFFYYVIEAYLGDLFVNIAPGTTFKEIGRSAVKKEYIVFPEIAEQRRIAAYLDKTCAAIDAAIEKKQKQLETLDALRKSIIHKAVTRGLDDSVELKDSGVEWIGRVPKHWKSFRIKDVAQLSPDFSNGKPNATDLCTVIPMEAVSETGQIDASNIEEYNLITNGLTNFEVCDVIFAKITPCMENGKGAYVESLPTRYAFGSTEFHVLRPRHVVNGKFLYYYTFNSIYRDYAEANMSGAAGQKRVSSRFINYTKINLPSKDEQAQIVDYLDNEINRFNELGVNLKNQISTLEQYRKSLIHECVTGKRRIAEADMQSIHQI